MIEERQEGAANDQVPTCSTCACSQEAYCQQVDLLFSKLNQRTAFRTFLAGLLLLTESNKTLTVLAHQAYCWRLKHLCLEGAVVSVRVHPGLEGGERAAGGTLASRCADGAQDRGMRVIDESRARKWGTKAAHLGRQHLADSARSTARSSG